MNKTRYLCVLCAILVMGTVQVSQAQIEPVVGLRGNTVRMSGVEKMEALYMAPAYAALKAMAQPVESGPFEDLMPEEDAQLFGGGLIYGSQIERFGLQLTYFYFITADMALGGDFSLFFPQKQTFSPSSKSTWTQFSLNAVGHYIFYYSPILYAYALTGVNLAFFRYKVSGDIVNFTNSNSYLGLNLGAGLGYLLSTGVLYLELKYIISNEGQFVLAVGYRHKRGK